MGKQALLLCDMPNLWHWPAIQNATNGQIGSTVFKVLERISRHFVETADFSIKDKWVFGDANFDGMIEFLPALHGARWKYIYCPRKIKHIGKAPRAVSVSDDVMKSVTDLYLASEIVSHFVFISDDGDFALDAMKCLEYGRDVTCVVSGGNASKALLELKHHGASVVYLDDIPFYEMSTVEQRLKQRGLWSHIVKEIMRSSVLSGVSVVKETALPIQRFEHTAIGKPMHPVDAVERFNRRYGEAQK